MSYSYPDQDHAPRITDSDLAEARVIVDNELRTMVNHASVIDADCGDIDDIRAAVLDPFRPATDLSDERYSVPDPWNTAGAFASVLKVSRGKRGTSKVAKLAGRAPVMGSTDGDYGRIPASIAQHAIAELRTLAGGFIDGGRLAVLTDAIYGDDIPPLIGAETFSWSEVVPMSIDGLAVTVDRFRNVGLSGGASARLDRAVGPEYRTHDDDPRDFPTTWQTNDTDIGRAWPTRRRLRTPRLRKGEVRERFAPFVVSADGDITVTRELLAPAADIDHAFIGHRHYVRPVTRRAKRTARKAQTTIVTLPASVPLPMALAPTLEGLKPGKRVAWRHGDASGTATMSASGRVNVRGGGVIVRSGRSVSAVVRAMRLQIARTTA